MKTIIVIPALNPNQILLKIVSDLNVKLFDYLNTNINYEILIVNDGSNNKKSLNIINDISLLKNTKIIHSKKNYGKGFALKKGIKYAKENGFDFVITADADGQHSTDDIIKIFKIISYNSKSYVLGVRKFDGNIPFRSKFGNLITKFLFRRIFNTKISDTQTGLRAFSKSYYDKFLNLSESKYDFEMASLITASKNGEIVEVPIKTIYEPGNPTSYFRPLIDSSKIYSVILRYIAVVPLVVLLELILVTNLDSYIGYSYAFLIARIISLIVYFLIMKKFVFKSHKSIVSQSFKFLTLALLNILIIQSVLLVSNITSDFMFMIFYFIIHSVLFCINFFVQDRLIFKK